MSNTYYIGWDVGGWNCEKNSKSRDAIVILDANGCKIGEAFRVNLRNYIIESKNTLDFVSNIFTLCDLEQKFNESSKAILAIDAPLGFSKGFKELLAGNITDNINKHQENPYLFRTTEKFLFEKEFTPLSSVKDRIGSQTTKAMHVVAKFTPKIKSCGVWQDENGLLTVIETYPAACRKFDNMPVVDSKKEDIRDAHICATIAKMFDKENEKLEQPPIETSKSEGWIWIPKLENAKFINE
ncbi:MAG TPA: hypothetical protein PK784_08230 [Tenuifilaceae bacterium]|nr:hypothetical protein [Tenuifilaceae bacterium]HPN22276.1 hypothetical protein [Tenuifilaceae bacterium]